MGVFFIAEHFGVSGVLASVGAGIMLSWEINHNIKEDHFREALDGFWGIVEPSFVNWYFYSLELEQLTICRSSIVGWFFSL